MECGKKKKKKLRNNVGSSEIGISDLPDSVIHYIFSFLETRVAVQTCVLSKRWRNFWTSLPYLRFSALDHNADNAKSCVNFIRQVLLRRDFCPVIQLCFESNSDIVCSLTEYLVCYAVNRQVKYLKLKVNCNTIRLPHCFNLASKSIEVLELTSSVFREAINWIKLSQLSSLKTLHISGFIGFDTEILLSCPKLENLKIYGLHNMVGSKKFNIHSHSLKTLEIESFSDRNCVCSLMVPKLSYFKYTSGYPLILSVESSVSLKVLDVVVILIRPYYFGYSIMEDFERLISLFKAVRNAKRIVLCPRTVKVLSVNVDYLQEHPSSFPRLEHLKLIKGNDDFNVPNSVLLYFLNTSTK